MKGIRLIGLVFALSLLTVGCMLPPQTKPIGTAARTTLEQQIADPNASEREDTGLRLDGRAGAALMERYHMSFEGAKSQAAPYMILQTTPAGK